MKLIALRLRHFKGIERFELVADGNDLAVFGDNAAGKTTLVDAFMWLLFGKDSANRKDFELKTLGPDGRPIHNLEHEVEAELELGGGRRVALKKIYKEVWTRRRGSAVAEFTGHTTDHYIDGVPVKKAEYDAFIGQIADEQRFRLLTDPTFFNQHLHWQERRKLLLEVCGDVTDEDVIASDPALADLPAILNGRSLEDHRKVIQARRREINQELERIPVRIDEVRRGLPNIDGIVPEALADDIAKLRAERQAKMEERTRIESGGQVAELQRRLAEVQAEITSALRIAENAARAKVDIERDRLTELEARRDVTSHEHRKDLLRRRELQLEIDSVERRMGDLRRQWHDVNERHYDGPPPADVDTACPACGQNLPDDQVEDARRRAQMEYERRVSEYNERKAEELERISNEGKLLKRRLDELKDELNQLNDRIEEGANSLKQLEDLIAQTREDLMRAAEDAPDPHDDPEVQRLQAEADRIAGEIETLRKSNTAALAAVDAEIARIDAAIQGLETATAKVEAHKRGLNRIAELEAEEKRLAAEFEELERQLHLCDLFIRAKVKLLTDRINSRFRLARFKLFNVLVNGGIEETCETTYEGVPYGSLNHGARLNVGLDIINTLADHFGFAPPVWIDNAESVTSILPTKGQQIRLVVSPGDKVLRIEQHAVTATEVA